MRFLVRLKRSRLVAFRRRRYTDARRAYYKNFAGKFVSAEHKVSIVIPCYNTPPKYFEPLLASVYAQTHENWELVLADASDSKESSQYIKQKSFADTRIKYIKIKNKGIAANTNEAINEATGVFISFMDHDDTLDPNALAETVDLFESYPELTIVYTDEDKITDDGSEYFDPFYKPGFSLDTLRNVNYINHLTTVRTKFLKDLGGIREGFDGAQDFDFLLRSVDAGAKFGHIQKVLYHWRVADGSTAADFSNKKHITDAGRRALDDHYARNNLKNIKATVIANRPGFYSAQYSLYENVKRTIYLDFNDLNISDVEKNEIIKLYKTNDSVVKNSINVKVGTPDKNEKGSFCVIRGVFVPSTKKTNIATLFAVAEESGVHGVSPKITRHGKIVDMGIINANDTAQKLFYGFNPTKPNQFGSIEWVRNVDDFTGKIVFKSQNANDDGRKIIWTHEEFIALESSSWSKKIRPYDLYNNNLDQETEYLEKLDDHISDLMEANK